MKFIRYEVIGLSLLFFFVVNNVSASEAIKPTQRTLTQTINLTQTSCQFIESENGFDQHFKGRTFNDCERLNERAADQRLAKSAVLRLKAGDYLFRVKNRDVPYPLGFWLRGSGLSRFSLPSVSGGGIAAGQTNEYAIALEPGEYIYSCPLNPTPDYILIVK